MIRPPKPARQPARRARSDSARALDPARALYESIPGALLVLGRDGHVLHANAAAEMLLGVSLVGLRGRPFELGAQIPLRSATRGRRAAFRRRDGVDLLLRIDSEPVLGADGEPYQVVASLFDVTGEARPSATSGPCSTAPVSGCFASSSTARSARRMPRSAS